MGFAGAQTEGKFVLLAGVAGLLAGAFSMAAGEYVSMRAQRELFERQIELERGELEAAPEEEQRELALIYQAKGLPKEQAEAMAARLMENPEVALDTLVREELGLDPSALGSPWGASMGSFLAFAAGALVPVIPFLFSANAERAVRGRQRRAERPGPVRRRRLAIAAHGPRPAHQRRPPARPGRRRGGAHVRHRPHHRRLHRCLTPMAERRSSTGGSAARRTRATAATSAACLAGLHRRRRPRSRCAARRRWTSRSTVERLGGGAVALRDGETVIAEGAPAAVEIEVPEPVTLAEAARRPRSSYPGHEKHIFPSCFVCGPRRGPGDGLRIFPGWVAGRKLVAAPWTPDPSLAGEDGAVRPEFVWASLDCPGAWAMFDEKGFERAVVLGRLAARLLAPVRPGERCVVVGWPLGEDGRKLYAGTALFGEGGDLRAFARATWVRI